MTANTQIAAVARLGIGAEGATYMLRSAEHARLL